MVISMEIIREENNWKLGKLDNVFYLICPSGENVKLSITSKVNLDNCFNHAVRNNWTNLDRTYFIPQVLGSEVKISKHTAMFVRSDKVEQWEKGKYLSKEDAKNAIEAVLPRAKDKFKACLEAYNKTCQDGQFSVGFNYDGDTQGIYDEYEYICFKMEGFNFQFKI
jgi:hypothetical protein